MSKTLTAYGAEYAMADINLITAPDRLYNDATSFFLLYPSNTIKEQFNNLLHSVEQPFNVYLYEHSLEEHEADWLLSTTRIADYTIIDVDNCPTEIQDIVSYLIANPKTYWLTKGEHLFYNKISNKRIYTLDYFIDKIGGSIEA